MIFTCSHCGTEVELDETSIPEGGYSYGCKKCQYRTHIAQPENVKRKILKEEFVYCTFCGTKYLKSAKCNKCEEKIQEEIPVTSTFINDQVKQVKSFSQKTIPNSRMIDAYKDFIKEYLEVALFVLAFISPWQTIRVWLFVAAGFTVFSKFFLDKYTFVKCKSAFLGYAATAIGLIYLMVSINKDTAVDGYHNLGLMNEKTNWTVASSAVMIFGVLLIIYSKFIQPSSESPKKSSKVTSNISDELTKLVEMKNAGVLTEDEFLIAKRKLLQGD